MSKAAAPITEEKEEQIDIDVETLALLVTANDGSLGKDAWKNLSRVNARQLISETDAPKNPILRDLFVRALLSDASLESGSAPSSESSDKDLFVLRLEKLVEAGAFDEAFRLYRKLGATTPTPLAAQMGIDAMIGNQQLGIACLESKAMDPSLRPTTTFWVDLQTFCNSLLGPASGPIDLEETQRQANAARVFLTAEKFPVPSLLKDLNPLTSVRVMTLARTGAFDKTAPGQSSFEDVSLRTLGLLKTYSNPETVFGKAVAAQWDKLTNITESSEKSAPESSNTAPTAPAVSEKTKDTATAQEAENSIEPAPQPLDSLTNPLEYALSIFLQSQRDGTPIAQSIYDKIFSLTVNLDYVMPNDEIMNRLTRARDNKAAGDAVMTGLQILNQASVEKIHPVALLKVLETWNSLGLSTESGRFAHNLQKSLKVK